MSLETKWQQTNQLQLELLEMDRDFAPHQPLTEVVLDGRIQDLFVDWNDFTDHCLLNLSYKPVVWTGPHVFLTTGMGISDLVDSWHDAILHIYVSRSPRGSAAASNIREEVDEVDEMRVYSIYTTVVEHPTRTIDGICKLLSQCNPALHSVEFSTLIYPLSTLSLSRLAAGNIRKLEVSMPRGEWSGSQCQALASANQACQLEIMVDALTDEACALKSVLVESRGPSRLRLGATIAWEAFVKATESLLINTRLKAVTLLEVSSPHMAHLALCLAGNRGLEELALVGTFGSKECDKSFQRLMESVATHKTLSSLTLNLQLPQDVSYQRVVDLSRSIQDMVLRSRSLTHVSLPLNYEFLECMSIDVDRYITYNRHVPKAGTLRASRSHCALLAPAIAAVKHQPELIHLFLREGAHHL